MNFKCKQRMIEQVLTGKNLLQAMHKVQKNHGSGGVDRMPVTKLSELMSIDREALITRVQTGNYLPQAILGVEIPKGNGKYRLLGIPTVTRYSGAIPATHSDDMLPLIPAYPATF